MKHIIINKSINFLLFAVLLVVEAFSLGFSTSNATFDNAPNGYSWATPLNRKIQTNMDPVTGQKIGSVYRKMHETNGSGVLGGTIGIWESMFLGNSEYLYTQSQYQGGTGDQSGNPGTRNMYASEFINGYFFVLFSDLDTSSGFAYSQPMFTVCDARYGWDDVTWSIPKRIESTGGIINSSAWYAAGDVAYNSDDGYYYWTTTWESTYNNPVDHFMIVGRSNDPANTDSWEWTDYNELLFSPGNPDANFRTLSHNNIRIAYAKDIYGNSNGCAVAVVVYTDKTYEMLGPHGEDLDETYRPRLGYIYTTNWGADWSTGEFKTNWKTLNEEGNNFIPADIYSLFDWYGTYAGDTTLDWPYFWWNIDAICTEDNYVHVILQVICSSTEAEVARINTNEEKVVTGFYDVVGLVTETGVEWQSANYIASYMGINDGAYEGKSFMTVNIGYAGNGVVYTSWWDRPETRYQSQPSGYSLAPTFFLDDVFFSYSPDKGRTWSFDKTVEMENTYDPLNPFVLTYATNLTKTAGLHESGWTIATHGTNVASGTDDGVLTVYAANQYNDEANPIVDPQSSLDDFEQFLKVWKITGTGTGIETEQVNMIKDFELFQNYPNPFNPSTEIKFALQSESKVKLSVYNTKGELVKNLKNEKMLKGSHAVNFDASALNSGIYFYKLEVNGFAETKKMVLTR